MTTLATLAASPLVDHRLVRAPISPPWRFRAGTIAELDAINRVVRRAVQTWAVAPRVQRLAAPLLEYQPADFALMEFRVADDAAGDVRAVAAWGIGAGTPTRSIDSVLLHGLYVDPAAAGRRLGSTLLRKVTDEALGRDLVGIEVRAWRDAEGFFLRNGFEYVHASASYTHPRPMWRAVR